jgi:general nucleoside transport system permease protein
MVTPDSPKMPARHVGEGVAVSSASTGVVRFVNALAIPVLAIIVSLILFGVFVAANGVDPLAVYTSIYRGAFGTWFSWQNTLQRAAPLLLTALCTALPARLGLIVIGGEGALVMGAVAAVIAAVSLSGASSPFVIAGMMLAAMFVGGSWVAVSGSLRHYRGVNETISSLLLNYIAIALMNHLVAGPVRDPTVVHRPSSWHIGEQNMLGNVPGMEVHWGLVMGLVACTTTYLLMKYTTFGFAGRIIGGNPRAARMMGLPVGMLVVITCFIGGAAAGLAGMAEIAAAEGRVNSSIVVGYGYTGILIAFIARQNLLAIIPVAVLLGGIRASGGLLQRWHDLPDASVLVLQGIMFMTILVSEPLYGRWRTFLADERLRWKKQSH